MAIYHLSVKPISRASGRSAVAAIAYRAAEKLTNERDGLTHDFTRRSGVEHSEIVLPEGGNAEWAKDRSALWNAAEATEKRKDARVAREIEIALPHELTAEQRLDLTRDFAQGLADRYGVAVDFAIHSPHRDSSVLNHHAHIMMTTRKVERDGLGEKSELELENKKLEALGLPNTHQQVRDMRIAWEQRANVHLARAGLDVRIDHRSHQERGLEIEPTQHMGVHATQMERRGKAVSRTRLDEDAAKRNAALIREQPEQVLTILTGEKSVFDRQDVARALHRYIGEVVEFQSALAKVMVSPALVELQSEQRDQAGRVVESARYSTREMVAIERDMAVSADRMAGRRDHGVSGRHVAAAVARQDRAIRLAGGAGLAAEQMAAIEAVTGQERIAAAVGLAGAGKSTMLAAAREAWEAQGFRVHGAALAGKAAEGLEESSGIVSRTLASWERGWERGFDKLGQRDVFVIDEAGMVGSKQLSRFITEADLAGAKIVLVGDPEQLQPIGAGAAFRAVAERVGMVELEGIRRQREAWQRAASVDFGRHRTEAGLAAYAARGAVRFEETSEAARSAIVRDVMGDMDLRPEGSRLVLAHRRADVAALNDAIRDARQAQGELTGELVYQTTEGARAFATGDRVLFRENNRELGVKNGMLGTVAQASEGHLSIRLDSVQGPGLGRAVSVSMADYAAVDHGYATTIHKSQGATVDRAYVLASGSMDRHMTYVAMTRHRDGVALYAGRDEFSDMGALTARLSRSQAKETTLDYDRAGYAQRRGFALRGTESEIVIPAAMRERQVPEPLRDHSNGSANRWNLGSLRPTLDREATARPTPKRGMFDGLKLSTGRPLAEAGLGVGAAQVRANPAVRLEQAVDRYARAWSDIGLMRAENLPVLDSQKQAMREAGAALDEIRPGAVRDLRAALAYEPATQRAMTELQGRERAGQLVAGIKHEERVNREPELYAARLVKMCHRLEARHERLGGWEQAEARGKVAAELKSIAGALKRDPQLESVMRAQAKTLGITPGSWLGRVLQAPTVERAIGQSIGPGFGQERGLGLSR
jgi:Ti-type conjugative transfer relaxase TraA